MEMVNAHLKLNKDYLCSQNMLVWAFVKVAGFKLSVVYDCRW